MNTSVASVSGYKTYITSALTVIGICAGIFTQTVTWQVGAVGIAGCLIATFVRSGSKRDAINSAELATAKTVQALGPLLVKLDPNASGIILSAEEIAQAIMDANTAKTNAAVAPIAPAQPL